MKPKNIGFILAVIMAFWAQKAAAICPVCTVTVGAGIGLSRWLGIDDSITGLWLGAFLLSISLWTIDWLDRKKINFPLKKILTIVAYYALAIVPFYYAKIIANPLAFFCSCVNDKLLLGIIEGTAAFFFGAKFYEFLKQHNGGKAHFPYEKVVIPVATIILFTAIFYFIIQ